MENDLYVNDTLKSIPTEEEAIELLRKVHQLWKTAYLRLHKIVSSNENVLQAFPVRDHIADLRKIDFTRDTLPAQRSLGLPWNAREDTFLPNSACFQTPPEDKPCTRRDVNTTVKGLFGSLRFAAPVTAQAKFFLPEVTANRYDWGKPLPLQRAQL